MGSLAAVTVIGNDRPGIVAGVTKVLFEAGCNLEDVSSTILRGHFSMMLIVRMAEAAPADLEARLAGVADELGLVTTVRPVEEVAAEVPQPTHMVSVYGADRPGIVYRVTDVMGRRGINVTDLTSRVIGSDEKPVYALMLEVHVPEGTDLESELSSLREEIDVEVSVHPIEADLL